MNPHPSVSAEDAENWRRARTRLHTVDGVVIHVTRERAGRVRLPGNPYRAPHALPRWCTAPPGSCALRCRVCWTPCPEWAGLTEAL